MYNHRNRDELEFLNVDIVEKYVSQIYDFNGYVETLGQEDFIVMETGAGSFYWADKIEACGAQCFIIDPYRFRIIKDSWNKTDKRD